MCVADIVQVVRKSPAHKIHLNLIHGRPVSPTKIEAMDKKLKRHHNHKNVLNCVE